MVLIPRTHEYHPHDDAKMEIARFCQSFDRYMKQGLFSRASTEISYFAKYSYPVLDLSEPVTAEFYRLALANVNPQVPTIVAQALDEWEREETMASWDYDMDRFARFLDGARVIGLSLDLEPPLRDRLILFKLEYQGE